MLNIHELKTLYQNDNFYILDQSMNVLQHQHNIVNVDGIMLIYLLLSSQETTGITWVEFYSNGIFQSRQPVLSNEMLQDPVTGLDLLHILPLDIGLTFDEMQIYGGIEQTSQPESGYNFATIKLSQSYTKFPGEYIQILWNLQIIYNAVFQTVVKQYNIDFTYYIS